MQRKTQSKKDPKRTYILIRSGCSCSHSMLLCISHHCRCSRSIFGDIFKIYPRVQGQDFDVLPTNEEIMSFLRELGHTREINSVIDVIVDQMHQPLRTFDARINRRLSGKTTSLDKLRLSRAQILWVSSEEPTKKSKRVKRSAKKPTKALAGGVVIRETPEMPLSKKKEKVDIVIGKGIELLSDVALTEEAHKTAPSAPKMKPSVTNEGTSVKPWVPDVTEEESSEDEDDEEEEEDELVKTLSNDSDDEAKITNKAKGNENLEITLNQVVEDAHVTLSSVPQKTEVPVVSSSYSSDLASKFLNFSDIPHIDA
ncbi:hypothetical protein Tco_0488922 [Tanacetum coccineum]